MPRDPLPGMLVSRRAVSQAPSGDTPTPELAFARQSTKVARHPKPKAQGGGWGGIRTHETRKRLPVFKTGAFNRSATHPMPRGPCLMPARPRVHRIGVPEFALNRHFCAMLFA